MTTVGTLALVAAALISTLSVGVSRSARLRPLLIAAAFALWVAIAVAVIALVREDTSMVLVVDHTRADLSWPRRVMGLWGGSAGSLLLFTTIIATVLASSRPRRAAAWITPTAIATLTWTLVLLASPFETLSTPALRGSGLSPILEHWAMLIHPPLLYTGLALALVPALEEEGSSSRRSATMALVALTAALALGGRWAYVELGWGGWWAWDPVENVALIPWLLLVVHVHLSSRHRWARWSAFAIWPAVFAGTAMTRTSLRTSVHSFANAEGLGWTLWPLTAVAGVAALSWAVRARNLVPARKIALIPAAVVSFSALVIALGTFRPFLPGEATAGWFYTRSLFPVAVGGLVALGIAPRWNSSARTTLILQAAVGAVGGAGAAIAGGWTNWYQIVLAAALVAAIVPTLGGISMQGATRTLGHLGMVAVLAGALGGTASTSLTIPLDQGERRDIDGADVENLGVAFDEGPPPVITANLKVDGSAQRPSVAVYAERGLRLPEVATKAGFLVDRQYILRDADDDGTITLTANTQPFTSFVWLGVALIIAAFGLRIQLSRSRFSRRALSNSLTVDALAGDSATGSGSSTGSGAANDGA